jgi:hypothetical protein
MAIFLRKKIMQRKYHFLLLLVFSFVFCYGFELVAQNSEVELNSRYVSKSSCINDVLVEAREVQSVIILIPKFQKNIQYFDEIQTKNYHTIASTDSSSTKRKKVYFTIRLGQGGFRDDRSPIGKLGGGQLTLDIKPSKYPIALSISSEYYTNSPDPSHSYEIAGLLAVNLFYMTKLFKSDRANFFAGGGIGGLEVPKGENDPDEMERGMLYNMEAGVNIRVFWKIGLYGIGKYLYAMKKVNNKKVINFSEWIVLLGITFNFGL